MVSNLLEKFPPAGGASEACKQVKVEGIELWVQDHGMGKHHDDLPNIFDRFQRASNRAGLPGVRVCRRMQLQSY